MSLKYELIENDKTVNHVLPYQLKALRDFADVKAGDLGGYVNGPDNLSHRGNCWVYDQACLYDQSKLSGNAQLRNKARMLSSATMTDNCKLIDQAKIGRRARVYGNVVIQGSAIVTGSATLNDNVVVSGCARIDDQANVFGNVTIGDNAVIEDTGWVYDDAIICNQAKVKGRSFVKGKAVIGQQMVIAFGTVTSDLTASLSDSIRCQTGLAVNPLTNSVICYKRVKKISLKSFHDINFAYKVGEYAEELSPDYDNESCARGLHFSYTTYWDSRINIDESCLLMCEVKLDDIITCQEGKIRAKKCFVICICG